MAGKKAGAFFFFFFFSQICLKTRTENEGVRRRAATVPRRSLGGVTCWVDVGKAVLSFCDCPAPSGYGEDGVHSREAADKKKKQKTEDWKKLMRE